MKIIYRIEYNWFASIEGEEYREHEVGNNGVEEILEHTAYQDGKRWFYEVCFDDGHQELIFNPNRVFSKSRNNS